MSEIKNITCVSCPMGCALEVTFDDTGALANVSGYTCKRGLEYARQEATDPRRNISAVVCVRGCLEPLSVKTQAPIPKAKIFDVMGEIRALDLQAPVEAGQVLIQDAAGTGVAVVATKSVC